MLQQSDALPAHLSVQRQLGEGEAKGEGCMLRKATLKYIKGQLNCSI